MAITYTPISLESLIAEVKEIKKMNIEELFSILSSSIPLYLRSYFVFGSDNKVTRDNLNVAKEFIAIINEERRLLNFLLKNIDRINIEALDNILDVLDEVNEKTIHYYFTVLGDIEDAILLRDELRAIRIKKHFDTLTDTDLYRKQAVALLETDSDVRSFLNYENEFWSFIDSRNIKRTDATWDIMEKTCYVLPIINEQELICGIDMLIPKVRDLDTALLCLSLYQKAHNIYLALGMPSINNSVAEDDNLTASQNYENLYLRKKAEDVFGTK